MQPALEIAEQHGHGFDPLLVGQVLQTLFADFVGCNPVGSIGLGSQVELFKLLIRECEKVTILSGHGSPSSQK